VYLTRLALANVRNYGELEFYPERGLNVFVGANAQGKSNLLEAIALLGTGKSFRTAREAEIVRSGMPSAGISGTAHTSSGEVRLTCTLGASGSGVRKRYAINGRQVRYASYLGRTRIVTFTPADLQLVAGAPSLRRTLLNAALAQQSPSYYAALAAYTKHLAQKSALLRGAEAVDRDLLATYDERLVATGTQLMLERRHYVAALAEVARNVHAEWVGPRAADGELELGYRPNVPIETATSDAVAAAFEARLQSVRELELQRRRTLAGPHRDDLELSLGGRPLSVFGSQGQQRTAVLALKVAEYRVLALRTGEAPILLLDDVLSELDPDRQSAFLRGVESFEQAFVTTTHAVPGVGGAHFSVVAARIGRLVPC
jgi:DNA replication and repair protein RecF